jgi:hypothetical protein
MQKHVLGALTCLGAALFVNAGAANALTVTVNVGGTNYDVTTIQDTFSNILTLLGNPPSRMPWFGDESLAASFASAVQDGLGDQFVEQSGDYFNFSPLFAFNSTAGFVGSSAWDMTGSLYSPAIVLDSDTYIYAVLVPAPTPTATPGPLPLLGAAAAFSASRRIRRRRNSQTFSF